MKRIYAVADLHGRFDLLCAAYQAVQRDAEGEHGTIVHLGDYVDRGRESRKVVEHLMDEQTIPKGWKRICLKGNHEQLMIAAFEEGRRALYHWLENGGGPTLRSYGHPVQDEFDASVVPPSHIDWMRSLPALYEDPHRIFVHAGINPAIPLSEQTEEELLWFRYPRGVAADPSSKHIVHGHTPNKDGPELLPGRTNLDTLAWRTGRLVVGVFDEAQPGGPLRTIDVIVAPPSNLG